MSKTLHKNPNKGMVFGVCSGLSDYTGIDVSLLRLATVIAGVTSLSVVFWVYLLLGILLPSKNE